MAIVKHIKSRNANYSAAINYLLFEDDEKTGKKIVDTFTLTTFLNYFSFYSDTSGNVTCCDSSSKTFDFMRVLPAYIKY